jgi:hypothetical protein
MKNPVNPSLSIDNPSQFEIDCLQLCLHCFRHKIVDFNKLMKFSIDLDGEQLHYSQLDSDRDRLILQGCPPTISNAVALICHFWNIDGITEDINRSCASINLNSSDTIKMILISVAIMDYESVSNESNPINLLEKRIKNILKPKSNHKAIDISTDKGVEQLMEESSEEVLRENTLVVAGAKILHTK